MAALNQGDDKLQLPLINNVGNEVWKCKEAKQTVEEAPTLGDPEKRGIMMEAVAAVSYLVAGSDVLIMRHPESIRMIKEYIDLIYSGGSAVDVAPVKKMLGDVSIDLAALAPAPDLTIAEEKKTAPAAKKAPAAAKEAPKAAAKPAPAAPKEAPKAPPKAEAKPEPVAEAPKVDAAAAAAAQAKAEAEAQAAAEAKAKAEAEAKAKAEAEAQAKADAEAKAQAEAQAKAKAKAAAKMEAEIEALRAQREKARAERASARASQAEDEKTQTAAAVQKDMVEKLIDKVNWTHKRV
jgi:acetyl-CoA decarbonylase/synthase complex subunit delta